MGRFRTAARHEFLRDAVRKAGGGQSFPRVVLSARNITKELPEIGKLQKITYNSMRYFLLRRAARARTNAPNIAVQVAGSGICMRISKLLFSMK